MRKKILSLILALAMVLPLVPVFELPLLTIPVAAAASGTTGDCTWTLDGTVLTISGNGKMGDYTYSDPAPWGTSIKEVVIEDGVTTIGEYAFYDCESLTDVWYAGTKTGRENITIGDNNESLTSATWHYNSCLKNPSSQKFHVSDDPFVKPCTFCGADCAYFDFGTLIFEYTGSKIVFSPVINANGKELVEGTDYSIHFYNNVIPNDGAYFELVGKNEYSSLYLKKEFLITKKDISSSSISVSNVYYTGDPVTPSVTVITNGKTLTRNTDYVVQYGKNVSLGTGEVRIIGIGNYCGSTKRTFSITKKPVSPTVNYGSSTRDLNESSFTTAGETITFKWGGPYVAYKLKKGSTVLTSGAINNLNPSGSSNTPSFEIRFSNYDDGTYTLEYTYNSHYELRMVQVAGEGYQYRYYPTGYDITKRCTITNQKPTPPTVTEPTITEAKLTGITAATPIFEGAKTVYLSVTAKPSDAHVGSLSWSSSNQEIATVSDGVVTLKKPGSVVFQATYNGYTTKWTLDAQAIDLQKTGEVFWIDLDKNQFEIISNGEILSKSSDYTYSVEKKEGLTYLTIDGQGLYSGKIQKIFDFNGNVVTGHFFNNDCDTTCNICGATRTVPDHIYDNACDTTCNECGAERQVPDHVYSNACDTTCNECGITRTVPDHVYTDVCDSTCNECSATRTAPHIYDNACDTTCNVCRAVRTVPDHVYNNACDTTCNECGATRITNHTYDNACDTTCNECGAERQVPDHVYNNDKDPDCNECGTVRYDAYGTTGDCIWYLEGTKLTITGNGKMGDYTSSNKAPWGTSIKELVIEDGVTSIGDYAFGGCTKLTSFTIPDSVITIGNRAFSTCLGMASIKIPDSVKTITDYAFIYCQGLSAVKIPDSVTTIGERAFYACTSLTSITIGKGVETIGSSAFEYCTSLTSITIPNSVTSFSPTAFDDCSNLTSLTVSEGNPVYHSARNCIIQTASKTLIAGCKTSVIPHDGSVTSIGNSAFSSCQSLTSIIIPDSVTSIGSWAFLNCQSLTSIIIPNSVTSIGQRTFDDCNSLTNVWYAGTTSDKAKISIGDSNGNLTNATWHYLDNVCDSTCNTCAATRTPNHFYSYPCDESCDECGATRTVTTHVYDNACDANCNVCGKKREAPHICDNACDTTCNECGATREAPHNYDHDCDTTCNECGVSRKTEHYTIIPASVTAHTTKNSTSYPYALSSGWYQSTNKTNSSSSTYTITATHACDLVLSYKVSSESKYDKLTIKKNSTQLDSISGTVSEKALTISLAAGDQVTITYSKDASQSSGYDCGWFKFVCKCATEEQNVPSSSLEPTCTKSVECSICGTVVKDALGHSYTNACDAECNVCGDTREAPHVYDNDCDTTCNECTVTREAPHDYDNACDTTCNDCGNTRTVPDHVYDNDCDTACNECGAMRKIEHQAFVPNSTQNSTTNPFALSDGWYQSTNKTNSSSSTYTITAKHTCNLVLSYKVSSEYYDKLTIKKNSTQLASVSEEVGEKTLTISLVAGDQVTITYSKDSSDSEGTDCGWFKFSCTCEQPQPTCTDSVKCQICGVVLKPALGHTYDNICDTDCNTCGYVREVIHDYSEQGQSSTEHWLKCSVCSKIDEETRETHDYDNACDTICDECGYVRTITHDYSVLDKNETSHWMKCSVCSAIDETTREMHNYDNACDTTCDECGCVRQVPDHVYDNACDTDCNICGATRTITHAYDNACDTTCNVCGNTRSVPDHVYDNVCDSTCNKCGTTREAPHVYTNDFDTDCNVCDATRIVSGVTGDCTWTLDGTILTISGNGAMADYDYAGGPWGSYIEEVIIENGVTSIGENAFHGCGLTSISIPDSVTSIGEGAFSVSNLESITIPDSVTSIGDWAFEHCYYLTIVTIPDSVTHIGEGAFNSCNVLTSITIPDSVTSIGKDAFAACASLTSVIIPDSVTSIGEGAFDGCTSLTSVTIPDSVTSIGDWAFYDCTSLTDVWYEGSEADRAKISIGSNNKPLTNAAWHYNACIKNAPSYTHTYDNTCDTDCNVCGATRTITHTYDNACDKSCNVCGATRTVPAHKYDNACDTTCNECGAERTITHTYDNACDAECNVCKATRQVPDHVYDNDYDTTCNVCGAVRVVCGDFDGKDGVDMDDAIYILYHVNFPETYPVNQSADFDGNGKVNANDAIYLLFHVYFPERYPLH